ncbi:hypothetical protein LCGC14_1292130, partial [marine sediment metagenome]
MTRPGQGYAPVDSIYPHKGINTLDPATLADPKFSPRMLNTVVTDGLIRSRGGYFDLGNSIEDPVVELIEWSTESGARQLIAITTKHQYKFDATTNTWVNITQDDAAANAIKSTTPPNTVVLNGVVATYGVGDYIRIKSHALNDGVYLLDGVNHGGADSILTTTEGTIQSAGVDGDVSEIVPLTGDITNPFDWVVATDDTDTYLFVVNGGIDNVLWYDGTGQFENYNPADINGGGAFKAFTVALHFNHLMFGNYNDGSSREKFVIWSNNGDFQIATGFTAGVNDTSGSMLLPDSQGAILKLKNLGDRLAVYSENSIGLFSFIGGNFIFSYEQVLRETRLLSPRGIANLGPFHIYVSVENFFLFDGTRLLRTVGDAVQKDFQANVKLDLANQAFAFLDSPVNEIYFVIPTSSSLTRIYLLEYDLFRIENTRWTPHVYADQI